MDLNLLTETNYTFYGKENEFMGERLLRVGEAARYLGCSQQTLRNYGRKGILLPDEVYPSGHRFYSEARLDAFIQKHMSLDAE